MTNILITAYYMIGCVLVFNQWEEMVRDIEIVSGELTPLKMLFVFFVSFTVGAMVAPVIYLFERFKSI